MYLPSQGIALLLASILGIFGADKFYLGLFGQGIAMLLLSLTFIGLLITIPWAYICTLFLVISILWNSKPIIYPDSIKWAPITNMDKIIAWFITCFLLLSFILNMLKIFQKKTKSEVKDSTQEKIPEPSATTPNETTPSTTTPNETTPSTTTPSATIPGV